MQQVFCKSGMPSSKGNTTDQLHVFTFSEPDNSLWFLDTSVHAVPMVNIHFKRWTRNQLDLQQSTIKQVNNPNVSIDLKQKIKKQSQRTGHSTNVMANEMFLGCTIEVWSIEWALLINRSLPASLFLKEHTCGSIEHINQWGFCSVTHRQIHTNHPMFIADAADSLSLGNASLQFQMRWTTSQCHWNHVIGHHFWSFTIKKLNWISQSKSQIKPPVADAHLAPRHEKCPNWNSNVWLHHFWLLMTLLFEMQLLTASMQCNRQLQFVHPSDPFSQNCVDISFSALDSLSSTLFVFLFLWNCQQQKIFIICMAWDHLPLLSCCWGTIMTSGVACSVNFEAFCVTTNNPSRLSSCCMQPAVHRFFMSAHVGAVAASMNVRTGANLTTWATSFAKIHNFLRVCPKLLQTGQWWWATGSIFCSVGRPKQNRFPWQDGPKTKSGILLTMWMHLRTLGTRQHVLKLKRIQTPVQNSSNACLRWEWQLHPLQSTWSPHCRCLLLFSFELRWAWHCGGASTSLSERALEMGFCSKQQCRGDLFQSLP